MPIDCCQVSAHPLAVLCCVSSLAQSEQPALLLLSSWCPAALCSAISDCLRRNGQFAGPVSTWGLMSVLQFIRFCQQCKIIDDVGFAAYWLRPSSVLVLVDALGLAFFLRCSPSAPQRLPAPWLRRLARRVRASHLRLAFALTCVMLARRCRWG